MQQVIWRWNFLESGLAVNFFCRSFFGYFAQGPGTCREYPTRLAALQSIWHMSIRKAHFGFHLPEDPYWQLG